MAGQLGNSVYDCDPAYTEVLQPLLIVPGAQDDVLLLITPRASQVSVIQDGTNCPGGSSWPILAIGYSK